MTNSFSIKCQDKINPVEIQGYVVGYIGVDNINRYSGEKSKDWNLTHIPSGLRINGSFKRKKDAVKAAETLQRHFDLSLPTGEAIAEKAKRDVWDTMREFKLIVKNCGGEL